VLPPSGRYQIWLNAGTSEYLPIRPGTPGRDNSWSADDQQERLRFSSKLKRGILRGHTPDRPSQAEDMVRSTWRRVERGRTEMTTPQLAPAYGERAKKEVKR